MDDNYQLSTLSQLRALPQSSAGNPFECVLLQNKVTTRTARNGSEFLVIELSDATGSLSVNCFSGTQPFAFFKNSPDGSALQIGGTIDYYQDRLSPRLQTVKALSEEEVERWLPKLVPASTESPTLLWEELLSHVEAINHSALRATALRVFNEIGPVFQECPAAISMHHAYRHGLLEHTVHVVRVARALLPLYPEVDADMALTGALLHDIGKTIEYTYERITKKSQAGLLQGHVVLGYRMVRKAALQSGLEEDLLERLEHIILSHQGELEWGAAVLASTPEAVFVSLVDNLDAKMGVVQHTLMNQADGFFPLLAGTKNSFANYKTREHRALQYKR